MKKEKLLLQKEKLKKQKLKSRPCFLLQIKEVAASAASFFLLYTNRVLGVTTRVGPSVAIPRPDLSGLRDFHYCPSRTENQVIRTGFLYKNNTKPRDTIAQKQTPYITQSRISDF
ncbi:hypothetical protein [Leeuwenhoekiella sp. H156]|uniref:hypothetical protein n=1 Tax=Leeuwenhoekiella sp. H156 TaxID=3450128 RepID=UPI003FA43A54